MDKTNGTKKTTVDGVVHDQNGNRIEGAFINVWQTAPNTIYAVADQDQSGLNLRGLQRTAEDGRCEFPPAKTVP